ncbi:MAG: redox-regulated ATPase YchF [Acidobacteriota bacterium]
MEIALCGLGRAGKTTLWSILTGRAVPPGAKPETRRGVARVPDPRLDRLTALFEPKKHTPATVTYVDVLALERGTGRTDNPVLAELRPADALMLVLRAFDDPADPHPEGSIDPARDLELMETEFLLADLAVAQRRIERLDALIPKTNRPEDRAERELMHKVVASLESEQPLREAEFTADERKALRGFAFLTAKPLLVAVNLGEDDTTKIGAPPAELGLGALEGRSQVDVVALSARIEEEIAALSPEDAEAFRRELGIAEPALDRLIRASYRLLGLISFFTVGKDECRAWTIREGTDARTAAGTIHTDLERGFIRAEVIEWDRLLEAGSLAAARERGWLRLEGRDYVVRDGDVLHVRHAS